MQANDPENTIIYIVDDDEAVRDAMRMFFESAGHRVTTFASGEELLNAYNPGVPACLLLDLNLPGRNGLQVQEMLLEQGFTVPIIFLTGHGDVPAAVHALKKGAVDFIQKPVTDDQGLLEMATDAISRHRELLDAAESTKKARLLLASLTPREKEIMAQIAAGKLNKVIAGELGISERTVEHHRARVMHKLGVHSVAELVRLCEMVRN